MQYQEFTLNSSRHFFTNDFIINFLWHCIFQSKNLDKDPTSQFQSSSYLVQDIKMFFLSTDAD